MVSHFNLSTINNHHPSNNISSTRTDSQTRSGLYTLCKAVYNQIKDRRNKERERENALDGGLFCRRVMCRAVTIKSQLFHAKQAPDYGVPCNGVSWTQKVSLTITDLAWIVYFWTMRRSSPPRGIAAAASILTRLTYALYLPFLLGLGLGGARVRLGGAHMQLRMRELNCLLVGIAIGIAIEIAIGIGFEDGYAVGFSLVGFEDMWLVVEYYLYSYTKITFLFLFSFAFDGRLPFNITMADCHFTLFHFILLFFNIIYYHLINNNNNSHIIINNLTFLFYIIYIIIDLFINKSPTNIPIKQHTKWRLNGSLLPSATVAPPPLWLRSAQSGEAEDDPLLSASPSHKGRQARTTVRLISTPLCTASRVRKQSQWLCVILNTFLLLSLFTDSDIFNIQYSLYSLYSILSNIISLHPPFIFLYYVYSEKGRIHHWVNTHTKKIQHSSRAYVEVGLAMDEKVMDIGLKVFHLANKAFEIMLHWLALMMAVIVRETFPIIYNQMDWISLLVVVVGCGSAIDPLFALGLCHAWQSLMIVLGSRVVSTHEPRKGKCRSCSDMESTLTVKVFSNFLKLRSQLRARLTSLGS